MSSLAIRVNNLGKKYRIGGRQAGYGTLRDTLASAVQVPLQMLRNSGRRIPPMEIWALRDVSFEVKPGEVLGIIGRNGAGKSTLLKILSRITYPTVGRAEIFGRVGSLLEVGTGFHPELTGRENIYLNGAVLGMKKVEISGNLMRLSNLPKLRNSWTRRSNDTQVACTCGSLLPSRPTWNQKY